MLLLAAQAGREERKYTVARSRRHTPITAITSMASEKQDKRWANRNHRSATRCAVKRDSDPDATAVPVLREVSNEWAMAKDGRSWFGPHIPKLVRK